MEWNEMKQRTAFVVEASKERSILSRICVEFGISRQLGHKLLKRYEAEGLSGIAPRSRRPKSHPRTTSNEMREEILALRAQHPFWGATLLRQFLVDRHGSATPCVRTVERVLGAHGLLVQPRKSRGKWIDTDQLIRATKPNQIWTVDFKGWWLTKDRKPCFPLTVRDPYSRYLLGIDALRGTSFEPTKEVFERLFQKYGLPDEILSDNGTPFASVLSVQGLTRLSAWWVKLGIRPRRILPGCPFMNGSHERMHRDMKRELQQLPRFNLLEEQKRFDEWREEYNNIRPNQALQGRRPVSVYSCSKRQLPTKIINFEYSQNMDVRRVSPRGMISWHQKPRFISGAIAKEPVGFLQESEKVMSIWFCELKLGSTDPNFSSPLGGNSPSPASCRHDRNTKCKR
jgi:putative transposase